MVRFEEEIWRNIDGQFEEIGLLKIINHQNQWQTLTKVIDNQILKWLDIEFSNHLPESIAQLDDARLTY